MWRVKALRLATAIAFRASREGLVLAAQHLQNRGVTAQCLAQQQAVARRAPGGQFHGAAQALRGGVQIAGI